MAICREDQVHPLPDNVDFSQGAALGNPLCHGLSGFVPESKRDARRDGLHSRRKRRGGVRRVQLAAAAGMTVIASAGGERGRKLLESLGARAWITTRRIYGERLKALSGGRGRK